MVTEDEKCEALTEVAFRKAVEHCGSEEAVRRELQKFMGEMPSDEDIDCDVVLADGFTEEDAATTKATRRWVMCRAWTILSNEDVSFSEAVSRGWAEAREKGLEIGVEI